MNHVHRICRSLATLTRPGGIPPARHAALPAVPRPEPPRRTTPSPPPALARTIATSELRETAQPPRERPVTRVLPARLPHTIQLCIHCRDNPAGFWVSRRGNTTVRRPWCLSCCAGLDLDRCHTTPFDS